jgi:hypothetical protein
VVRHNNLPFILKGKSFECKREAVGGEISGKGEGGKCWSVKRIKVPHVVTLTEELNLFKAHCMHLWHYHSKISLYY